MSEWSAEGKHDITHSICRHRTFRMRLECRINVIPATKLALTFFIVLIMKIHSDNIFANYFDTFAT